MQKNAQTTALISHASKEILKILQARLQQYMNHKLPDVQAGATVQAHSPEQHLRHVPHAEVPEEYSSRHRRVPDGPPT